MVCNTPAAASAYSDLAAQGDMDFDHLYGGCHAVTPFVRELTKSTLFVKVPIKLVSHSGNVDFSGQWSANVTRAADYLLQAWIRVELPAVAFNKQYFESTPVQQPQGYPQLFHALPKPLGPDTVGDISDYSMRWTRNLGHNLIDTISMTFNDLPAWQLNNYHMDFLAAFTVPAGKRTGYNNMIGNTDELTNPLALGPPVVFPDTPTPVWTSAGAGGVGGYRLGHYLPSRVLNIPIPMPFGRDSGVGFPTAATPYNEVKINVCFRDWSELLIIDYHPLQSATADPNVAADDLYNMSFPLNDPLALDKVPKLGSNTAVWTHYALVSNQERARMGQYPRDMVIEQMQTIQNNYAVIPNATRGIDLRFSHAVKVFFFAVRNVTNKNEWSNYTAASAVPGKFDNNTGSTEGGVHFSPFFSVDPLESARVDYEGTTRLNFSNDYYSLVEPYFNGKDVSVPLETGYHQYSYALDHVSLDPSGSTNFGKLTNVTMFPEYSDAALYATGNAVPPVVNSSSTVNGLALQAQDSSHADRNSRTNWFWGVPSLQKFQFVLTAINYNVVRISGGAFGFASI